MVVPLLEVTMDIVRRSHRTDIDRFPDGPIGPCVGAFKQYLSQRRYAAKTIATYLLCITHFAQWADSGPCRRRRIDEGLIAEFLDEHLLPCKCAGAGCVALRMAGRGSFDMVRTAYVTSE